LGVPNNETVFVFSQAGLSLPAVKTILPESAKIFLVDHNQAGQSIAERDNYEIVGVIDHHNIADFSTASPVFMRVDNVGCTCAILRELFQEQGYTPSASIAYLMLSAIISDTLYFRSPTTTDRDRKAIEQLAKIAKIEDTESYSLAMFAAKSDLGDMLPESIIMLDYKHFTMGGKLLAIGVMETTSPSYAFKRKEELLAAMRVLKASEKLDHLLFSVVDIIKEENTCFVIDEADKTLVEEVFSTKVVDELAVLGNILSRKKQLVPMLEAHFAQ
jgi:manganese-dependent inorganic pyrophosphatase